MSTSFSPSFPPRLNAFDRGMGRWLNVDTVCCGRARVGSLNSRNTFSVPEIFIARYKKLEWMEAMEQDVELTKAVTS